MGCGFPSPTLEVCRLRSETRIGADLVRGGAALVLERGLEADWECTAGVGVPRGTYANRFCDAVIGVGVSGQAANMSMSLWSWCSVCLLASCLMAQLSSFLSSFRSPIGILPRKDVAGGVLYGLLL